MDLEMSRDHFSEPSEMTMVLLHLNKEDHSLRETWNPDKTTEMTSHSDQDPSTLIRMINLLESLDLSTMAKNLEEAEELESEEV